MSFSALAIFSSSQCLEVLFIAAYMPVWLKWGYWVSPLTYGEIGITVNEFLAPRWEKVIIILSCCTFTLLLHTLLAQLQGNFMEVICV